MRIPKSIPLGCFFVSLFVALVGLCAGWFAVFFINITASFFNLWIYLERER